MKKTIFILVIAISFILSACKTVPEDPNIVTGDWDLSAEVAAKNYDAYLMVEEDFDVNHELIQAKAKEIKQNSIDAKDAIMQTIRFVAKHVRYDSSVSVSYCYNEKASDVFISGKGDCVSMSRLVTTLLRAQGIPARTMGGCLSSFKRCAPVFATVPQQNALSVAMTEGDYKKRGYLHEWVEAWTPESGWMLIEATSGQSFPMMCDTYLEFGYDSNKYNRCVITDNYFWQECRTY